MDQFFPTSIMGIVHPQKQKLYEELNKIPSELWKEVRPYFIEGDKAVTANEWLRAAECYEKCIATVEKFEGLPPHGQHDGLLQDENLYRWICMWARCNLVPIYHFQLKFYEECIRTHDMLFLDLSQGTRVDTPRLKEYRRAVLYEWGKTRCEAGEKVEGEKLIQEALQPPFESGSETSVPEVKCLLCNWLSYLYQGRGFLAEAERWNVEAQKASESVEDPGVRFKRQFDIRLNKANLLLLVGKIKESKKEALDLDKDLVSRGSEFYTEDHELKKTQMSVEMLLLSFKEKGSDWRRNKDDLMGLHNLTHAVLQHPQYNDQTRLVEENMRLGLVLSHHRDKDEEALACLEVAYKRMHGDPTLLELFGYRCVRQIVGVHEKLFRVDRDVNHYKLSKQYLKEAFAIPGLRTKKEAELNFRMGLNVDILHYLTGQSGSNGSFEWGYAYYKKAAALNSQLLFNLETNVSDSWAEVMESNQSMKSVFWNLQDGLFRELKSQGLVEDLKPRAVVGVHGPKIVHELNSGQVCRLKSSMPSASKELVRQALIWAERGRTSALMYQLGHGSLSQEAIANLLEFDLDDKVAWRNIMSSLSVCGRGAKFVEYSYSTRTGTILAYVASEDGEVDMRCWRIERDKLGDILKEIHAAMSSTKEYSTKKGMIMDHLGALYEDFIHPIADLLEPMCPENKLVFIGNEILNTIPFPILRDARSKSYLFQRHTIAFSPSLRVLKHCSDRLLALKKLPLILPEAGVVVGDPAYRNHKRRLEGTCDEVDRITKLFGSEFVRNIKGTYANIKTVTSLAKLPLDRSCSQGFLHFAVHGQGGEYDPSNSNDRKLKGVLELAHPREKTWPPKEESQHRRTGLHLNEDSDSEEDEALAGNHQAVPSTQLTPAPTERTENCFGEVGGLLRGSRAVSKQAMKDGILSSEDIINSGFEWRSRMAVLSACDTYRGQVYSEGVLNLPRAFITVGIPCTVASQWLVHDQSAPDFMYLFYLYLKKGKDVASALRSSMLDMLNKKEEVYKWGMFLVYGLPTVKLPKELLDEIY